MNGKRPGGWVALACRYFRDPRFDDVSADAELLWLHAGGLANEVGAVAYAVNDVLARVERDRQ